MFCQGLGGNPVCLGIDIDRLAGLIAEHPDRAGREKSSLRF